MSRSQTGPAALAVLTDTEKAAVLGELMAGNAELGRRAEHLGLRLLATVEIDHVASAVAETLLALDQDDLAAHAGRTRYGYVEPTEAAWRLLEQAVQPCIDDLLRRARLDLHDAARRLAIGILQGLWRIRDTTDDDRLLSWAPDFADEAAQLVLRALGDVGLEVADAELDGVTMDG